ncbi:hypothetical protein JCM3774_005745 [Rhodotorula dairenensis]
MDRVLGGTPATASYHEEEERDHSMLDEEDDDDEDDAASSSSSSSSLLVDAGAGTYGHPDLPGSIPALVLHKAVAAGLDRAGFEGADPDALDELEGALASFFGSLLLYAHDLAEHARRHVPTVVDVLKGCQDLGIGGPGDLLDQVRLASSAGPETSLRLRYQRPRVPVDPGPLLPSDDDDDDDDDKVAERDLENDPLLASPPPSPLPVESEEEEEDDDFEFEEVTPLGPDGLPLSSGTGGPNSDAAKQQQQQRREAKERRQREKREKKERRERERDARRRERERRRDERARVKRKRQEADPLNADWLPALPPKHSWKQTPVYPESAAPPPIPPPISQTQQAPSAAALQHLSTLRARLNDSQLVAASLRNLIRKTRASAVGSGSGSGTGPGGLGGGGGGVGEQDSADVVDYESEWYGARGLAVATGSKRKIRVVTVGQRTNQSPGDLLLETHDAADGRGGNARKSGGGGLLEGAGEASRVGGAVKRRRWLV